VGLGGILLVIAIQLAALLLPIAAGLAGWLSGGLAGLVSIVAWAGFCIPASYAIIDKRQAARRGRRTGLAAVATVPSAHA
jgi:hypothetical protein